MSIGKESETRVGTEPTESKTISYYAQGTIYGILAGVLMGVFTWLISAGEAEASIALRFSKFIFLGAILGIVLYKYKAIVPRGKIFKTGIAVGAITTIVAAITMIIINVINYVVSADENTVEMFGKDADTFSDTLLINGILFFETFVAGMLFTFIFLQFFKATKTAD